MTFLRIQYRKPSLKIVMIPWVLTVLLFGCEAPAKHELAWERINVNSKPSDEVCVKPYLMKTSSHGLEEGQARSTATSRQYSINSPNTELPNSENRQSSAHNRPSVDPSSGKAQWVDPNTSVNIKKEVWAIKSGTSLRTVLENWSQKSGWRLRYQLADEWQIQASIELTGSFDSAINQLEQKLKKQGVPIEIYLKESEKLMMVADPITKI